MDFVWKSSEFKRLSKLNKQHPQDFSGGILKPFKLNPYQQEISDKIKYIKHAREELEREQLKALAEFNLAISIAECFRNDTAKFELLKLIDYKELTPSLVPFLQGLCIAAAEEHGYTARFYQENVTTHSMYDIVPRSKLVDYVEFIPL